MRRAVTAMMLLPGIALLREAVAIEGAARQLPLLATTLFVLLLLSELVRPTAVVEAAAEAPASDLRGAVFWTAAVPLAVALGGMVVGPALYLFGYLRLRTRVGWAGALVAAVSVAFGLAMLFRSVLPVVVPHGLLGTILGAITRG